jgi:molybdate transport system regulatory protein
MFSFRFQSVILAFAMKPVAHVRIRIPHGDDYALGPGKAALLEAIQRTGSISAAGRELKMSYRRAWLLVDSMNRCFRHPLVDTATGGKAGGGAFVTGLGMQALQLFHSMQAKANSSIQEDLAKLSGMLASTASTKRR